MNEKDDLLSYILSSEKRIRIMKALENTGMTLDQISAQCHINYHNTWVLTNGLKDKKLITRNNVTRNNIYRLTDVGNNIIKELK